MAVVGISLIVASVIWVVFRPPGWVPAWFTRWTGSLRRGIPDRPGTTTTHASTIAQPDTTGSASVRDEKDKRQQQEQQQSQPKHETKPSGIETMPPPPVPKLTPPIVQPPPIVLDEPTQDGQTTPKASATNSAQPIPSFSLQGDDEATPAPAPKLVAPSMSMPPPPRPPTLSAPASAASSSSNRLPAFPALNSAQRARGPLPNRNPLSASSSSGLAPPPTHSTKPSKPSRKVLLTPGHSPLDWARISGPTADLRGVPSASPYLRVTPSMLKRQNGRKGTDAWMGLNGKVYNVSPYADYHPGGVPELLRGAGKDGTKLFGEIHPWVNYETMLSACLVGLMVEEPEGSGESEMDKMD